MALNHYSVLKGKVVDTRQERDANTPHFQVQVNAGGADYRIAINVKSSASPSELKYIVIHDFSHSILDVVEPLEEGLHPLQSLPGSGALDYIRGNIFNIEDMKIIPYNEAGPDNDLNDLIQVYMNRLTRDEAACIYAFGETWGPENKADKIFGFQPGRGIHDIHMNQGNSGSWMRDNGVFQDGGLLFHYPAENQWVGVFLAFQSQSIHTDDVTGDPIDTPTHEEPVIGGLRIVAASVNPLGDDVGKESITIINISPDPIPLAGWTVTDRGDRREALGSGSLAAGKCLQVVLSGNSTQLSNNGGEITLLTPSGLKAHGVSYTKNQASDRGWTIVF